MPLAGRKPKPEDQRRTRHPLQHDWIEVVHRYYDGPKPDPGRLPAATARWWEIVSRMPHCILWDESDWAFAVDTAKVHAVFVTKKLGWAAIELRNREKLLGTTLDSRRDLRIRYVDEASAAAEEGIVSLDDFRASIE